MPTTIDYVKTLPQEVVEQIKNDYLNGDTVYAISKRVKLSGGIVNKIVIQTGAYIASRRSVHLVKLEELPTTPYSTNEMHYGTTGAGKYTWESLEPCERQLIKQRNHKELKKI